MKSVSVVLATLGEKNIFNIIEILEKSKITVEIIIIIPKKNCYKIQGIKRKKNIVIIKTDYFSQTKQRAEGFKISKYDLVLQLDTDVIINENFLNEIINFIDSKDNSSAVSIHPKNVTIKNSIIVTYIRILKNIFLTYFINREKNFKNWDSWFTNNYFVENNNNVKLLTGACIMHHKKNLIDYDFYRFDKKAYGEDILHSCLLYKKNIKFYIKNSENISFLLSGDYYFKTLKELNFFIKRMYFVYYRILTITDGNIFIFYFWFFLWFLNQYIRFTLNKIL